MASGDKVYIADKPTLDAVKENTDNIKILASKIPVTKRTSIVLPASTTVTLLNLIGTGAFLGGYTDNLTINNMSSLQATIDGTSYEISLGNNGAPLILGGSITGERFPLMITSYPEYVVPVRFKSNFKLTAVTKSSVTSSPFTAIYELYE